MTITPEYITELKRVCGAAPKGQWRQGDLLPCCVFFDGADEGGFDVFLCPKPEALAAFIVAARTALPALIAEVERLEAENDSLVARVEAETIERCARSARDSAQSRSADAAFPDVVIRNLPRLHVKAQS
jgi:hypothetical protein